MKKKLYERPTIAVVPMRMTQMLCTSGTEATRNGYEYEPDEWEDE